MKLSAIFGLFICLVLVIAGCGGNNSYSPDFGKSGDFTLAVFNGASKTIGDGTGKQANSKTNPFTGAPGSKMTIVVKPQNGFAGAVALSTSQSTGQIVATQPTNNSVNVKGQGFGSTEVSYILNSNPPKPGVGIQLVSSGTFLVTATSGKITKTFLVTVRNDTGDFKVTVFNSNAATTGNGVGKTPNSNQNPFTGAPGSKMTILVEAVGPFKGTVALSVGSPTGGILPSAPTPSTVSITPGTFKAAETTYILQNSGKPGTQEVTSGSFFVTATSGTVTKNLEVFIRFDTGDFSVTVFNSDSASTGNGNGKTPNSSTNPFRGAPDEKMTILVKSVGNFAGTANVSVSSGNTVISTSPTPNTLAITPGSFKKSEFSYQLDELALRKVLPQLAVTDSVVVTVSSGSVSHQYTVFIDFDSGDFTFEVYNDNKQTIGDGTGFTPNGAGNPFGGAPGEFMTIVVKPVAQYGRTVTISTGAETGGIIASVPNPSTLNMANSAFKASEFTYSFDAPKPGSNGSGTAGINATVDVTISDGFTTHTKTVFIGGGNFNRPGNRLPIKKGK